ncbi:hypothetical protein GCM10011374_33190 [Kocuria dechangensis]|uniref:Uncharacterized protein n=1 Tax=Kocuria dechangensis TaxID=1176249 RepID=A0A917H3N8_9MICC|nr:hypothetical protein [Kocuria dechangensis]GGG66442.1 hypothetical protein GCM10011374_33190 [Kocuria dechangensis]
MMTHQPEEREDDRRIREKNWLADSTEELNARPADGPAGPLSEQPAGENTEISTEPQPPSGA